MPGEPRIATLGFLVLILTACTVLPAGTAPIIRIGLVAPFEGRQREIGYDLIYAARLCVRQWNGRGGVENYRVELVALDDGGDPERARRAAQSLGIDPAVVGVMGHWLAETTAAARPAYAQVGLPLIPVDKSTAWPGRLPESFAAEYQAISPLGDKPGPYAPQAYHACNRLVEAIGQAIAAEGQATRAGVAAALLSSQRQGE